MRAAIDVGTNTVRLLLGETAEGRVIPERYLRRITRLGGGLTPEGALSDEAMERTLVALAGFADELRRQPPDSLRAVGTEALRAAANGGAFAALVRAETGIPLEIIDGEEEARLSALGVLSALSARPGSCLIFDIGGGSTEFILCADAKPLFHRSYPLGVVRLCEDDASVASQQQRIDTRLDGLFAELSAAGLLKVIERPDCLVVGTAGTVTTLAALHLGMTRYDWRRVNNHILPLADLRQFLATLSPLTAEQREALPGMEQGRGDLIVPGLRIVMAILSRLARREMVVSDFGLLEGVLLCEPAAGVPPTSR